MPRVGSRAIPSTPYPFTSLLPQPLYLLASLIFTFFHFLLASSIFLLFILSHSTTIVPLHFQAGCCRRRLNLGLVFFVSDIAILALKRGIKLQLTHFQLPFCQLTLSMMYLDVIDAVHYYLIQCVLLVAFGELGLLCH